MALFDKSYKIAERRCPDCDRVLDGTTPVDGVAVPKPGDLTICVYCGCIAEMAVIDGVLGVSAISDEQREQLLRDNPEIAQAMVMREMLVGLGIIKTEG